MANDNRIEYVVVLKPDDFKKNTTLVQKAFKAIKDAGADAAQGLNNLPSKILNIKTAIVALGVAFVSSRIVGAITETAEALDQLNTASQRTGLGVGEISKLKVLAATANVDFGTLTNGIGRLNRAIAEFKDGNKNVKEAFSDLGISSKAINSAKSVSDLLPKIADGLDRLTEGEREQTLRTLFGGAGPELGAVLAGGGDKLRKNLEDISKLNLQVTKQQAQVGADLSTQLTLLSAAWFKVKVSIVEAVGPTAIKFLERFTAQVARLVEDMKTVDRLFTLAAGGNARADQLLNGSTTTGITQATTEGILKKRFRFIADLLGDLANLFGEAVKDALTFAFKGVAPLLADIVQDAFGPTIKSITGGIIDIGKSTTAKVAQLGKAIAGTLSNAGLDGRGNLPINFSNYRDVIKEIEAFQNSPEFDNTKLVDIDGKDITDTFDNAARQYVKKRFGQQIEQFIRDSKRDPLGRDLGGSIYGGKTNLQTSVDIKAFALADAKRLLDEQQALIDEKKKNDAEIAAALSDPFPGVKNAFNDLVKNTTRNLDDLNRATDQAAKEFPPPPNPENVKTLKDFWASFTKGVGDVEFRVQRFFVKFPDQAKAFLKQLTELQKKVADARGELGIAELAATGQKEEAAQAQLNLAQLDRRAKLVADLGVAFRDVAAQLTKLEGVERTSLGIQQRAEKITTDLEKAEASRSSRLADLNAQLEAHTLTQADAAQQINDTNTAFKEQAFAALAQLEQLRRDNPEFAKLLDERLQKVRQTAAEIARINTDPKVTAADGLRDGLRQFVEEYQNTYEQIKQLTLNIAGAIAGNLSSAIGSVIDGTKKLGQAFRDFAVQTLQQIANLIVQMLIFRAISGIIGASGGGAGAAAGFAFDGIGSGKNAGGLIPGSGPDRDSVLTPTTPGEHVTRRRAVNFYTPRALDAINRMLIPRAVLAPWMNGSSVTDVGKRAFNDGGMTSAPAAGGGSAPLVGVIPANEQTMEALVNGGPNALLRFAQSHRNSYRAALGL